MAIIPAEREDSADPAISALATFIQVPVRVQPVDLEVDWVEDVPSEEAVVFADLVLAGISVVDLRITLQ